MDVGVQPGEFVSQALAVKVDVEETAAHLLLGGWRTCGEVDQVRLLNIQLGQLGVELPSKQRRAVLVVVHDLDDLRPEVLHEPVLEADLLVVLDHGLLDDTDLQEWLTADALLPAAAEEIEVDATFALGALQNHSALSAFAVAGAAPQAALEVVVPHPLPFC